MFAVAIDAGQRSFQGQVDLNRANVVDKLIDLHTRHKRLYNFLVKILMFISHDLHDTIMEIGIYVHKLMLCRDRGAQILAHSALYIPDDVYYPRINEQRLYAFYEQLFEFIHENQSIKFNLPIISPNEEYTNDRETYEKFVFLPLEVLLWINNIWYEFHSCDPTMPEYFVDMDSSYRLFGDHYFKQAITGP